jgi:hypothetical protein
MKQFDRDQTVRRYKTFYGQLTPPSAESLLGTHKGEIIGRKMQRALGRPSLFFMQLGGWWGKQFDTPEQGINIVQRRGQFRPKLPMLLEERPSLIDGKPSLVIVYPPASPFLWPWIVDEVRRIDDSTCLGMTVFTPFKLVTTIFALDAVDNNPL